MDCLMTLFKQFRGAGDLGHKIQRPNHAMAAITPGIVEELIMPGIGPMREVIQSCRVASIEGLFWPISAEMMVSR